MAANTLPRRRRTALSPIVRRWPSWAAPAAAIWSIAYAAMAIFWALGGTGFPFGEGDSEAADMGSLFVGARADAVAAPIAAVCAGGAVVAFSMARRAGGFLPRRLVLLAGWVLAVTLTLAIPDVRLMRDFAYLFAGFVGFADKFDWPAANQVLCLAGGVLWAGATLDFQRRTRTAAAGADRRMHDAATWARRGRWFTLAAILLPVPYEIIRWAWALGFPVGVTTGAEVIEQWSWLERAGMLVMGGLPLVGGLLTHGLTQTWGEVYPRWVPRLAGKTIPVAVVVVPAALATVLIVTGATSLQRISLNEALGRVPAASPDVEGWGAWAPGLVWLPWGLALGAATYAYWRRRLLSRGGRERA
jgi:hypothetical protein